MTDKVMTMWLKRKENLSHDYALVGFLLSPNPTIMAAAEKHTEEHKSAVARLIEKLFVDPILVGRAKIERRAKLIDTFWQEYSDFTMRVGRFKGEDMWFIAEQLDQPAHVWHKTYSVGITEILGLLACIVTSKILGIGTAERNWKQLKSGKNGQRASLSAEKCKQQALIYGRYQQQRAKIKYAKLSTAGKLWDDDDFTGCKMDVYCSEIIESLETQVDNDVDEVRIFRAWVEEWEKKKIGPQGDVIFEQRLVRKYGNLKWLDPDNNFSLRVSHPERMSFTKARGNNKYDILATMNGYDLDGSAESQNDLYDVWETGPDFFNEVIEYYKESTVVRCYKKGGLCDSDEE